MFTLDDGILDKKNRGAYHFHVTNGRTLCGNTHAHTFYEFVFVLNGVCEQKINHEVYEMKENDLTVLLPGDQHSFLSQSDNANVLALSVKRSEIEKHEAIFNKSILTNDSDKIFRFSFDVGNEVKNICEKVMLCEAGEVQVYSALMLEKFFYEIIMHQTNINAHFPKRLRETLQKFESDIELIRKGVPALESLSGYSRAQITRLLKKYLHKTPQEYISDIRFKIAYRMIIHSDCDLWDISEKIGYSSFEAFQKRFKTKFGITPFKLRKQYTESFSI